MKTFLPPGRGLGATVAALASLYVVAGPAGAAPTADSAPTLQFGGFEIAQNLWACSVIVDNAVTDAGLTIDETLSSSGPIAPGALPEKVAGGPHVNLGVVCLPTSTVNVTRVTVVAASTSSATAEAYRNAIRADIAARAKGAAAQRFKGPAVGAAPSLVIALGRVEGGRHKVLITPPDATAALRKVGLATEAPTAGGEVAGRNANVGVVVAANVCSPGCSLPGGVYAVFSSSSDANAAGVYRDEVQRALLAH